MQENSPYDFWKRVDELRKEKTVKKICEDLGLKYTRIRDNRSEERYPNRDDMVVIAKYLNTTVDYLMTGIHIRPVDNLCPEARYVQESPEARLLVSQVMKDPALLSALAVVIESTRKEKVK